MTLSYSSAQSARQRVADQLKEMRQDARLTGRAFAALAGWTGGSKVSRIEHGTRPPSVEDVHTWCRVCGVGSHRAEALIAELHAAENMWQDWRRAERGGLMQLHQQVRGLYASTRLFRVYCADSIPGLLQTDAYTRAALTAVRDVRELPLDDVEDTVAERAARRRLLRNGTQRLVVVMEEIALRYRAAPTAVMVEQLEHLIEATTMPTVSLGIIPEDANRRVRYPVETFYAFDDQQVQVELVSGFLTVTQEPEIALYLQTFRDLLDLSVRGPSARRLIESAVRLLR
jgi:transcriptional regulator with XRE-family HTH domain